MDWDTLIKPSNLVLLIGLASLLFLFRNNKKEAALLLFSLVFSIFAAEILLRLFYPQIMEHDKMFEYDPSLG